MLTCQTFHFIERKARLEVFSLLPSSPPLLLTPLFGAHCGLSSVCVHLPLDSCLPIVSDFCLEMGTFGLALCRPCQALNL